MTRGAVPLRLTAWDGSGAGPAQSLLHLHLADESAVAAMLSAPGDLGLARAYVSGSLELEGVHPGDPYEALRVLRRWQVRRPPPSVVASLLRSTGLRGVVPRPRPAAEAPPRWRRSVRHHTPLADERSVRRHYDVSNAFYELVLGPSMVYSCALFEEPGASLEQAQEAKLDLVALKLGLREGMHLLDVGCGWGAMVLHAARRYGVRATGITLSPEQAEYARAAVQAEGLSDLVRILVVDYRYVPDGPYDAICSIGMAEHVGIRHVPGYFCTLAGLLTPGGRLLNHCITRSDGHTSPRPGEFVDRYVFPDGELPAPALVVGSACNSGLEVRHDENLREHYPLTLRAWGANLVENWDEAVQLVGAQRARVWGLYMAGARLSFEENTLQVHQLLATRTTDGASGMPWRPDWS